MTQTMQPGYGPPQGPPNGYPQQGAPQLGYAPAPQQYQQAGPPPPPVPAGNQQVWNQQAQSAPSAPVQSQSQAIDATGDDEFFTSDMGGQYMSFAEDRWIGVERGGEIIGIDERQQTNRDTKEPEFWPDGRKIMMKIVTLQTGEREDKDDKGIRSVWLPTSKDITKAVIEAMKQSTPNEMRLHIGGKLFVTRTGSRQTTQKNGQRGFPAFTYTARYFPPQSMPQHDPTFMQSTPQGAPSAQQYPQQGAPGPQQLQQVAAYVASTPNGGPPPQAAAPQGMPWQQPGAPAQQVNHYATGPQGAPPPQQQYQQAGPPPQPSWAQQGPPPQQYQQQGAPQNLGNTITGATGYGPNGQPMMVVQGAPPQGQYPQQPAGQDPANPFGAPAQAPVNQSPYPQQPYQQAGPPPQGQYYPQQ